MEKGYGRSPSSQGWQQSEAFQTPSQRADDNEQMSSGSTSTPIRSSVDREIWPVSYATFHATTTAYPLPPVKVSDATSTTDVVSHSLLSMASPSSSSSG